MERFFIPYQAVSSLSGHRVAVLAPHADDEVFGCGGALASFVAQGRSIHVVVVSDEEDQATTSIRHAESRAAAKVMGYAPPTFWGLADGQLVHSDTLADKIRVWLLEVDADLVLVTSCWEMHRDHRALAEATIRAVVALEGRVRVAFYEVGQPLPTPNTLLDITLWKEVKERAMACFPSQLARQSYDRQIRALNVYRTYSLPSTVEAAEAYRVLTAQELVEYGLDQEPHTLSGALYRADREQAVLRKTLSQERRRFAQQQDRMGLLNQRLEAKRRGLSWRLTASRRLFGHRCKGNLVLVGNALGRRLGFLAMPVHVLGHFLQWIRNHLAERFPADSASRYVPKVTSLFRTPAEPERIRQRQSALDAAYPVVQTRILGEERWQIEFLPDTRSAEMVPLFQRVFGIPLDPAFREWKYGQGRGRVVAAWNRAGALVAHYGGLVRTVSFFGTPVETCQVGDVMVDPAERGVLTRKGVFFRMTQVFYESQGRQARQAAFGFPNQRAFRVGKRLGFYDSAGKMYLRTWHVPPQNSRPAMRDLWAVADWSGIAQELWQKMAAECSHLVLVQRDAEYLDYRYRQRPKGNYGVYLMGSVEQAQAIIVVKPRGDVLDWMDYVGTRAGIEGALAGVKGLAARAGLKQVQAWLTEPMLDAFFDKTAETQETDVEVAQWDCDESRGEAELTRGRWWAMYGDTDFL